MLLSTHSLTAKLVTLSLTVGVLILVSLLCCGYRSDIALTSLFLLVGVFISLLAFLKYA